MGPEYKEHGTGGLRGVAEMLLFEGVDLHVYSRLTYGENTVHR